MGGSTSLLTPHPSDHDCTLLLGDSSDNTAAQDSAQDLAITTEIAAPTESAAPITAQANVEAPTLPLATHSMQGVSSSMLLTAAPAPLLGSLLEDGQSSSTPAAPSVKQMGAAVPPSNTLEESPPPLARDAVVASAAPSAASPPNAGLIKLAQVAAPIKELRRSNRIAAMADVHALHKADRLTTKKNLEFPGNSFINFPVSKVVSNLGRVGINIGSSDVVAIKNLEVDRLVLHANQTKSSPKHTRYNLESDEERENQLDAILSHACGDQNENLLETEGDQIIDLSPLRRKKKYNNAKILRKGKLPKKPKAPSKIII